MPHDDMSMMLSEKRKSVAKKLQNIKSKKMKPGGRRFGNPLQSMNKRSVMNAVKKRKMEISSGDSDEEESEYK